MAVFNVLLGRLALHDTMVILSHKAKQGGCQQFETFFGLLMASFPLASYFAGAYLSFVIRMIIVVSVFSQTSWAGEPHEGLTVFDFRGSRVFNAANTTDITIVRYLTNRLRPDGRLEIHERFFSYDT